MITKEDIKEDLLRIFQETQNLPKSKQYNIIGKYSRGTVENKFGSWTNALRETFGKSNIDGHGSQILKCQSCEKLFKKSNGEIKKSPNHYCSKRCSGIANILNMPPSHKTKKCRTCDILILSKNTYCKGCFNKQLLSFKIQESSKLTIREFLKDKQGSNKFNKIRSFAKALYQASQEPRSCYKCGYDKHIEICHMKNIASFPETALLEEVNNINNLKALCCNCHWEFDNGLIEIGNIKTSIVSDNKSIDVNYCNIVHIEDVKDDLKKVYTKTKKLPTKSLYEKHGEYASLTVLNKFGSWTNALLETFGKCNLSEDKIAIVNCQTCDKEFVRSKRQIIRNPKNFCCLTCKINKKRKCRICFIDIVNNGQCNNCFLENGFASKTLLSAIGVNKDAAKFSAIRGHARTVYDRFNDEKICKNCGYNKHVEICHKKDISSFTLDTLVKEINHPDNLIALCPNCHWEFDRGWLELQ